jgi:DNA repair exonuclease SbcCD ATPase subunit
MTTEERLDRIEHLNAGLAEERRKDREEYKALWRETQRQLNELSVRIVQLSETDSQLQERIQQFAAESRAADKRLEERIESLVSGIGRFIQGKQ